LFEGTPRAVPDKSRSEINRPRCTRSSCVVSMCSSARKRWTQRSQFTGIPRNPSQTPMKVAAYEITLMEKLCNSTP
jgi:hypothetical protein